MPLKTFKDVSTQNVKRSPLAPGEETSLGLNELLSAATGKDGTVVMTNFRKKIVKQSGREFSMPGGVVLREAFIVGSSKAKLTVPLSHVPMCIATILDKVSARIVLASVDLQETLVLRGMDPESAKATIDAASASTENARPGDLEIVGKLGSIFGDVGKVRFTRVPSIAGGDTTLVFSAIDLVMAAKGCEYRTAQVSIWRIFKEYYGVDLDDSVNLETLETRGFQVYRVRFGTGGGQESVALDAQGASELLCLIPGSEVSAALRRRAVDTLLRVEGGDESLIDRIKANRRFQEYLQEHDPDHPMRAVGEHAERRRVEEAGPEALRRAEMEMVLAHRKRMLDLEYATAQQERDAKAALALQEIEFQKRKLEAEEAAALQEIEFQKRKLEAEEAAALREIEFQKRKLEAEEAAALRERDAEATAALQEREAKAAAALRERRAEAEATKRKHAAEDEIRVAEVKQRQEEVHEAFRRQRASTIAASLEALRAHRPDKPNGNLSPRSMSVIEDELRTSLLGRERPDAALGRPLYASKFLQEQLLLRDWAAKERSRVFGSDVKAAVAAMFPEYDLDARTNRSVGGVDREIRLYYEAHERAFHAALKTYLGRAATIRDDELTREGLAKRKKDNANASASWRNFFGKGK